MKNRLYIMLLALALLFLSTSLSYGAEVVNGHLEGGIANEVKYQEVVFITGEPVLLTGTAKVTTSGRTDKLQTRITCTLTDSSGQIKLTRSTSYSTVVEKKLADKQTVTVTDTDKGTESITVGKDRYTLTNYQYHRSILTDNKPGVDYFSGNWNSRKTYTLNNKQATVIVESWGETVGYNHAWGNTETQKIDCTVTFSGSKTIDKEVYEQDWSGTYQLNASYNKTRDLSYQANEPTQISFAGGYLQTEQEEQVLQYSYNMPRMDDLGLAEEDRRKTGDDSTKLVTSPTQKRLPIPFLRDVKGHWAEDDILRLASLEALPVKGEYVGTSLNMTRGEFAWAIAKLAELLPEEQPVTRANPYQRNQTVVEESPFADVPTTHPYYQHIKAISDKGIISGVAAGKFGPDQPLTRAQALTLMIRVLGFEGLAPMYNVVTNYNDDYQIPYWARDAVYIGTEIGLVTGQNGSVKPNETMSRAEAAAFLNRFIRYMQKDMRYEYRERLMNFR